MGQGLTWGPGQGGRPKVHKEVNAQPATAYGMTPQVTKNNATASLCLHGVQQRSHRQSQPSAHGVGPRGREPRGTMRVPSAPQDPAATQPSPARNTVLVTAPALGIGRLPGDDTRLGLAQRDPWPVRDGLGGAGNQSCCGITGAGADMGSWQVKTGKAAGVDGIPPEIWKHGGQALLAKFHEFVVRCWELGKLPSDLRDAVIITLYKKKGDKPDCSNYRGITLLSIAGKILARILLNRLIPAITEGILPESQCGFRANRSTTDMVFVLRRLQEKSREQNKGLYVTFVDLTKAFDTVSRKGLWQILERLGCPPKFLKMIISLHEDQHGQVRYGNALSEPF
ncbi:uncharacterized protein LOC127466875 [Manacus candei]|uniref:uncharacterized protein LOC127466875 n=1 Tax=Manacus candei TaxID=415023 RepID=UPI002226BFE7|nr:uncharacterized protein LOC127466875 [Manacus candei]